MFTKSSDRLVLRYGGESTAPGQFTFRHFVSHANDADLYNLAHTLNSFQEDEVKQVARVQEYEFIF